MAEVFTNGKTFPTYSELVEAQSYIKPLDVWRNHKNQKLYTVIGVGAFTEEDMPILVAYEDNLGNLWFRPWKIFLKKFDLVERVESHE
jgi:hypothetical protein